MTSLCRHCWKSYHTADADATKQFRRVGGVYWAFTISSSWETNLRTELRGVALVSSTILLPPSAKSSLHVIVTIIVCLLVGCYGWFVRLLFLKKYITNFHEVWWHRCSESHKQKPIVGLPTCERSGQGQRSRSKLPDWKSNCNSLAVSETSSSFCTQ